MGVQSIQIIFDEIFGDAAVPLEPKITARDVIGWDSFAHINLIVALEEAFSITFSSEEMSGMKSVGDLVVILKNHGCDVSWDD